MDIRRPIACTCAACALAGVLLVREPIAGGERFAWVPQVRYAGHMPHVPEAYYSSVVRVPTVTITASGYLPFAPR